jgi:hypothetical protein
MVHDRAVPFTLRNLEEDLEHIGSVFEEPPDIEFRAATKPPASRHGADHAFMAERMRLVVSSRRRGYVYIDDDRRPLGRRRARRPGSTSARRAIRPCAACAVYPSGHFL